MNQYDDDALFNGSPDSDEGGLRTAKHPDEVISLHSDEERMVNLGSQTVKDNTLQQINLEMAISSFDSGAPYIPSLSEKEEIKEAAALLTKRGPKKRGGNKEKEEKQSVSKKDAPVYEKTPVKVVETLSPDDFAIVKGVTDITPRITSSMIPIKSSNRSKTKPEASVALKPSVYSELLTRLIVHPSSTFSDNFNMISKLMNINPDRAALSVELKTFDEKYRQISERIWDVASNDEGVTDLQKYFIITRGTSGDGAVNIKTRTGGYVVFGKDPTPCNEITIVTNQLTIFVPTLGYAGIWDDTYCEYRLNGASVSASVFKESGKQRLPHGTSNDATAYDPVSDVLDDIFGRAEKRRERDSLRVQAQKGPRTRKTQSMIEVYEPKSFTELMEDFKNKKLQISATTVTGPSSQMQPVLTSRNTYSYTSGMNAVKFGKFGGKSWDVDLSIHTADCLFYSLIQDLSPEDQKVVVRVKIIAGATTAGRTEKIVYVNIGKVNVSKLLGHAFFQKYFFTLTHGNLITSNEIDDLRNTVVTYDQILASEIISETTSSGKALTFRCMGPVYNSK